MYFYRSNRRCGKGKYLALQPLGKIGSQEALYLDIMFCLTYKPPTSIFPFLKVILINKKKQTPIDLERRICL